MDLKETDILGPDIGKHWYYSSKARAMIRVLGDTASTKVLDVGAGSGFFSRYLLTHTNASEAWCVDISYEADSESIENGKFIHYMRTVDSIDVDLVLMMDVLEHVDDDVAFLKAYVDKVPDGTRLLITVPAFQFLWSGHDDFLDHKRRYTLKQLETVIRRTGLTVTYGAYYFGMVFPIAAILRLAQKAPANKKPSKSQLTKHSFVVNAVLKLLCKFEFHFMHLNRMAGLTVFCLAHKHEHILCRSSIEHEVSSGEPCRKYHD